MSKVEDILSPKTKEEIITSIVKRGMDEKIESDNLIVDRIPFILKMIVEAEADIESNGIIVHNSKNEPKSNPALSVHRYYLEKLTAYLMALGVTPRERKKLEKKLHDEAEKNMIKDYDEG